MPRSLAVLFVSTTANLVLKTETRLPVAVVALAEVAALAVVVAEAVALVTVVDEVEDVAVASVIAAVAAEVVVLQPTAEASATFPARRRPFRSSTSP